MNDSLRRDDFKKPVPVPTKTRKVKRYQIMYTTLTGDRKTSRKVYEYATARKLVARLNRLSTFADAYASPLTVKIK